MSPAPDVLCRVIGVLTFLILGLSYGASQPASTTGDKAAVTGKVTDQSGAVIRNAKVVLTNPIAEGVSLAVPVDDRGVYTIVGLYPGTYTLTVSADELR